MECYRHPRRSTTTACSRCYRPVCEAYRGAIDGKRHPALPDVAVRGTLVYNGVRLFDGKLSGIGIRKEADLQSILWPGGTWRDGISLSF